MSAKSPQNYRLTLPNSVEVFTVIHKLYLRAYVAHIIFKGYVWIIRRQTNFLKERL